MPRAPRLRSTVLALLAAVLSPLAAIAQPTLTGATLFNADANGNNNVAANGGQFRGSYRTDQGVQNQYAGLYLSTAPDAMFSAASVLNNGTALQRQLALGANTFYFYASGIDRLGRPDWGLNLFFGTAPYTCATPPLISAFVAPGATQTPLPDNSASTTTRCTAPTNYIQGANTLAFTSGQFLVQLTDFRVLAESDMGSTIDRVSQVAVGPDGMFDNYGTLTLTVRQVSAVPEPSTYVLLATGLATVTLLRRVRRRAP